MVDKRVEKLAKLCIYYSVGIKPKEKVLISGSGLAFPLINELYKECLLSDAYPMVIPRPDIHYTFFKYAKEHQLKFVSPFDKLIAEDSSEYDMQQIVGWTHLVKARFLNQKGKHMESLETARQAETMLEAINNYAGVANSAALIAEIYKDLEDGSNEKRYREKSRKFMEKAKAELR